MAEHPIDFRSPPIDEVLIGVTFSPLAQFHAMTAAAYWQEVRADYPEASEQPPVIQQVEKFDRLSPAQTIMIPMDYRRYWFIGRDPTSLIQLQRDFYAVNWRKVDGSEQYPGFDAAALHLFDQRWPEFCAFAEANAGVAPNVLQCEVTYVDNLVRGEGWDDYRDLPRVLAPWCGQFNQAANMPSPERVALNISFLIPDVRGRITMTAGPAIRGRDNAEIMQIQFIARMVPDSPDVAAVGPLIRTAHDWTGRVFRGVMSEEIQAIWRD